MKPMVSQGSNAPTSSMELSLASYRFSVSDKRPRTMSLYTHGSDKLIAESTYFAVQNETLEVDVCRAKAGRKGDL
jgi:hypothetical protein